MLASFYGTGRLTVTGERFNPHGLTAASYDYALGTTITVTNPHNGRTCQVRVNDRGPNGIARVWALASTWHSVRGIVWE